MWFVLVFNKKPVELHMQQSLLTHSQNNLTVNYFPLQYLFKKFTPRISTYKCFNRNRKLTFFPATTGLSSMTSEVAAKVSSIQPETGWVWKSSMSRCRITAIGFQPKDSSPSRLWNQICVKTIKCASKNNHICVETITFGCN